MIHRGNGTGKMTRATYFSQLESELLMSAYAEYEHILTKKGNTAVGLKAGMAEHLLTE